MDFGARGVNYGCKNCILEFAKQVIAYLREKHFLVVQDGQGGILPTPLGKAAFASSISPEESARIFDDLEQARRAESLVLETDLHLLYLTTPHFKGLREPNWDAFIQVHRQLSKAEQRVGEIYGIDRDYMEWARSMRPRLPNFITEREGPKPTDQPTADEPATQLQTMCLAEQTTEADYKLVRYSKFYMALQANEILKETPVPEICAKFGNCPRGTIQTVQQQAQNFAGMMGAFCERLGWTDYSALFLRISDKINW